MKPQLSQTTKERLKDLGVGIVYLFGSRASGIALDKSDYDVGVVLTDYRRLERNNLELFTSVYKVLDEDIPDKINGPKLDISFLQKANPALQIAAVIEGIVLFENDPAFRADYEEDVIKRYDDYRFLQREYEEATFAAFSRTHPANVPKP